MLLFLFGFTGWGRVDFIGFFSEKRNGCCLHASLQAMANKTKWRKVIFGMKNYKRWRVRRAFWDMQTVQVGGKRF